MTCIIALEHDGKVYMGGDSAAVAGWDIEECADPKVFVNGDFAIGYTSSFRMGQLLQYALDIPENSKYDDMEYMVKEFIPAVRKCLKDGGYTKIDNNQEEGGFFLVGYRGRAYKVASDFQVTRMRNKFISVGCGSSYAMGAMAASEVFDPEKRIRKALSVAEMFSNGVRGPHHVVYI